MGHGQDQAGTAQALQVGEAHLAQTVVAHAFRPGNADRYLLQAIATAIQVNIEAVRLQINQCRSAGAIEIRQAYPR